jgi:methionyl-tRNA formyltransferase
MLRDLRRLRPGVVVLANAGLVSAEVITVPAEGVVNVHPGLLPWVRGNSPIANGLLAGVPLGCTAFRVDSGIDTGPLLLRRLLPVSGGESLDQLREALRAQWVGMTADLVEQAARRLPAGSTQHGRYPLGPALPLDAAEDAVRRGEAAALFTRWRAHCDEALVLPADADPPVGATVGGA